MPTCYFSFGEDQPFPLKFIKDKNGNVIKMLAFDRDLWEKDEEMKKPNPQPDSYQDGIVG